SCGGPPVSARQRIRPSEPVAASPVRSLRAVPSCQPEKEHSVDGPLPRDRLRDGREGIEASAETFESTRCHPDANLMPLVDLHDLRADRRQSLVSEVRNGRRACWGGGTAVLRELHLDESRDLPN